MTNRIVVQRPGRNVEGDELSQRNPPRLLLVPSADAARILGIGRTTLYELVKSGDLTPIHVRRCVRFSMHEIEQFVESLRRAA